MNTIVKLAAKDTDVRELLKESDDIHILHRTDPAHLGMSLIAEDMGKSIPGEMTDIYEEFEKYSVEA